MTYRTETFDGREHVVFPAVLAVEGVLNEAFVSADELAKSAPTWNGRAIPLLHPEQLGMPISVASSPEVLERRVGTVFGAEVVDDALVAELWIDPEKMNDLGGGDVLESMQAGEILDVSTGYFSDDVLEHGTFNGEGYAVRHINIRPDHLALLPGQVGACSVADGCGVPRVHSTEVFDMTRILRNQQHTHHGTRSNDDDDEAVTITAAELQALIDKHVKKALAEVVEQRNEDDDDDEQIFDAAGNLIQPTAHVAINATFGSQYGDDPLAVTVNKQLDERAKARRAQASAVSTGKDFHGNYRVVKTLDGGMRKVRGNAASTDDSPPADGTLAGATLRRRSAA